MRLSSSCVLAGILTLSSCNKGPEQYTLKGRAQGTTFTILYHGQGTRDVSEEIESLLLEIDESVSLWREDSFIYQVNSSTDSMIVVPQKDRHFIPLLGESRIMFQKTKGAFDPTVYPLVKAWGFGAIPSDSDSIPRVDSLLKVHHVGKLKDEVALAHVAADEILMKPVGMQFDFNGIAQGYTVDEVGRLLISQGVEDFMVEIGGELLTKGRDIEGDPWSTSIEKIQEGPREPWIDVQLNNEAMATSGNYRKYQERNGKRYSHFIDPKTGYPVEHQLLAVTVIAPTCMEADAYATAFMVMGLEKSTARLERGLHKRIEALFIYDEQGRYKVSGTGRFEDAQAAGETSSF